MSLYLEYVDGTIYARNVVAGDADISINVDENYGNGFTSDMSGTYYIVDNSNISTYINNGNFAVTTLVTDMSGLFTDNSPFNQDIGKWDVANVTDMHEMFAYAKSFNQDIGNWNVDNVTDMNRMFNDANDFNQNIGNWNVENVTDMNRMFNIANDFNQDIGNWNVDNVTNMTAMFNGANDFNQNIGNWNVENVFDMRSMFTNANSFNQNIGNWNVANVTSMFYMFYSATSFNQNIGNWNVENVFDMRLMFSNATSFNQNLRGWDVSANAIVLMMFNGATALLAGDYGTSTGYITNGTPDNLNYFNQLQLAYVDGTIYARNVVVGDAGTSINVDENYGNGFTSDMSGTYYIADDSNISTYKNNGNFAVTTLVTDMNQLFDFAMEFNQDITHWDVANVTNMGEMFAGAMEFNQDINGWNTSNVTNMNGLFKFAYGFNQNIGNWNVENVTDMGSMFTSSISFNQDISGWNVSNVTEMGSMFGGASSFNQDIGNWNVENVNWMKQMFSGATSFNQNLRGWDVIANAFVFEMFNGATALLDGEYGTSLGTEYIGTDGTPVVSTYFNQVVASTYGDPHINPLYGELYELPNREGIYRMLEGEDLIINASVRRLSKEATNEMVRYFDRIGILKKYNVSEMLLKGVYYDKIFVEIESENLEFNYRTGEMRMSNKEYFKLKKEEKKNESLYGDKNQLSGSIRQYKVIMNHSKYGKIELDLNYYSNPQTRYGLGLKMRKNSELSGLLVREYKAETMEIKGLKETYKRNGKLGKNKVLSNIIAVY